MLAQLQLEGERDGSEPKVGGVRLDDWRTTDVRTNDLLDCLYAGGIDFCMNGFHVLAFRSRIILSQLANCLYDSGSDITRTCEQPPTADHRVAQAPHPALPSASGWRPGQRWRMRRIHRQETARDAAYGQRASAHPFAGGPDSR